MDSSLWLNVTEACSVYCTGDLLKAVQLAPLYNDSKTFVDMPMINDPSIVLQEFYQLAQPISNSALQDFVESQFLPAGSDLVTWVPNDWSSSPSILRRIDDPDYYSWTEGLNNLWLLLGRNVSLSVHQFPQRHSYLPRNYPMVVPGGRFRESYYWDSWWILQGLIACDMYQTSADVISNLLEDIDNFGYVPNGARIYYLGRSQLPVLSEMILMYYNYMASHGLDTVVSDGANNNTKLIDFLQSAYYSLQREYSWWMNATSGHLVVVDDKYVLNRYHGNYTAPRPESYLEDYTNAPNISEGATSQQQSFFYRNVRAGAETGWDFSSRWIPFTGTYHNNTDITYISTMEMVPVDLNSIMYRLELNLAYIGQVLNSSENVKSNFDSNITFYLEAADARYEAIQAVLWDNNCNCWKDYNTSLKNFNPDVVSVASWIPLWANIVPNRTQTNMDLAIKNIPIHQKYPTDVANALYDSFNASGLIQSGGVLTTLTNTGQQWDAPNAWPPLVWFSIEGLYNLNTSNSNELAVSVRRFM